MSMEAIGLQRRRVRSAADPRRVRLVEDSGRDYHGAHTEYEELPPWSVTVKELRDTKRELQRVSSQLLAVQENERKRIAADLHDGIGQSLSLLKLSTKAAIKQLESSSPAAVAQALAGLEARVQGVLNELRRVCHDLRPSMLDDLGILPTLSWLLREVEQTAGDMKITQVVTVEEAEVPEGLKSTVYRIVQEALCNIAKHAEASQVRVALLRTEDSLLLIIEDNGRGFDPDSVPMSTDGRRGFGLRGMLERAQLSGGRYRMEAAPGKGTRIEVNWPMVEPEVDAVMSSVG